MKQFFLNRRQKLWGNQGLQHRLILTQFIVMGLIFWVNVDQFIFSTVFDLVPPSGDKIYGKSCISTVYSFNGFLPSNTSINCNPEFY